MPVHRSAQVGQRTAWTGLDVGPGQEKHHCDVSAVPPTVRPMGRREGLPEVSMITFRREPRLPYK